MKFRFNATITLFTLLWAILFTYASDENKDKIVADVSHEPYLQKEPGYQYLQQTNVNILFIIFYRFLTVRDILIFRRTCKCFENLLQPDGGKMVTLSKTIPSQDVCLAWMDLRYFLHQSIVFEDMFNTKEYHYTVLTSNKEIIFWHNRKINYPAILFNKIKHTQNFNSLAFSTFQQDQLTWNGMETAWVHITNEGNVTIGGDEESGGKISLDKRESLFEDHRLQKNVKMIRYTNCAFAALLNDGTVLGWGDKNLAGVIPRYIKTKLKNVKTIVSSLNSYAALLEDGSVVTWGHEFQGGLIPSKIQLQLSQNVKMVASTSDGFAALLNDGTVLPWGYSTCHPPRDIATQLKNVKMLFSDHKEFVALLDNGCVFSWGGYEVIPIKLKNVKMVFSNVSAFVALFNDDNIFAWGYENCGGCIPLDKQDQLINNVQTIFPQDRGFKAICKDGTVIQWGKQNEDEL